MYAFRRGFSYFCMIVGLISLLVIFVIKLTHPVVYAPYEYVATPVGDAQTGNKSKRRGTGPMVCVRAFQIKSMGTKILNEERRLTFREGSPQCSFPIGVEARWQSGEMLVSGILWETMLLLWLAVISSVLVLVFLIDPDPFGEDDGYESIFSID